MWGSWNMFSGCLVPRYCSSQTNNKDRYLGYPRRNEADSKGKILDKIGVIPDFRRELNVMWVYIYIYIYIVNMRWGSKMTLFILIIIGCSLSVIVFRVTKAGQLTVPHLC